MSMITSFGKAIRDFFFEDVSRAPRFDKPLGTDGTVTYDGYINSPEENAALQGAEKYRTYSNVMLNTSIVASGVRHFLRLCGGVGWKQQPADDSDRAKELAEKVQKIYLGMDEPWSNVVIRGARTPFLGFSVQELVRQAPKLRKDGVIGLQGIYDRPQRTITRWDLDKHGRVVGCVQLDPQSYEEIYLPRQKILYLVDNDITSSPDGAGLLRHVVEPSRRLARYEQLEGYSFESDLRGVPKVYAPIAALKQAVKDGNMSQAEANQALADLRSFMANHVRSPGLGIMMDSTPFADQGENQTPSNMRQWDVQLLKTDTGAAQPVNVTIERLNREIARILGVEYLLLGGDTKGSHALSRDKTQTFGALVQSTVNRIGWTVDREVTPKIFEWNGWPLDLMPKSVPDAVALRDIEEVVDTLVKLSQAGAPITPDDPAVNEIRSMINLSRAPEITPEELQLWQGPPAKPGSPPGGVENGPQARTGTVEKPKARATAGKGI